MAYSPLAQAGKLKDPTLLKLAKLYGKCHFLPRMLTSCDLSLQIF